MGFFLLFFFCLFFVSGMFAHAAACLTAVLTEAAISTGVFLKKDYFTHYLY